MPAETHTPMQDVEDLVAFGGRRPGSDAERRAAVHLAKRLESIGRHAEVEPTFVFPEYGIAHALHALVAIVGSVLSVDQPVIGAALVGAAVVLTVLDATGIFQPARRVAGRRASQNVVSPEGGEKPGVLILTAHYDSARTGSLFGPRVARMRALVRRRARRDIGLFEPILWSMLVIGAVAGLRIGGIEALALTIVQFVPTVVLIVYIPVLIDIPLSDAVPGAADNASGVSTALRLGEHYGGTLESFDLWLVFAGANEGHMLGMRRFLRAHRDELDRASTIVLDIDKVARGRPCYATKEGLFIGQRFHPTLVALCDELAEEHGARRVAQRTHSDAHMARMLGYPAIRISCLGPDDYEPHEHLSTDRPGRVEAAALDRAFAFCSDLVELIDERVGPDLPDAVGTDLTPSDEPA